jgi:hypothetical protein
MAVMTAGKLLAERVATRFVKFPSRNLVRPATGLMVAGLPYPGAAFGVENGDHVDDGARVPVIDGVREAAEQPSAEAGATGARESG